LSDQDNKVKIIEPLAKFHVKVHSQYRITFPKETREAYKIQDGDYVIVILRKISGIPPIVLRRALLFLKVSRNGVMVLPKDLVQEFEISIGEILEVLFIRHIPAPKIYVPELSSIESLSIPHKKGFVLLSEFQEKEILSKSMTEL